MRAFAFNDYAGYDAVALLKKILEIRRPDIRCLSKADLFDHDGHYDGKLFPGAALVLHNNSDGFGANIETEGSTSLDGAIGVYSSAAAGLNRRRTDLTAVRL
jgi:hypothetical protein